MCIFFLLLATFFLLAGCDKTRVMEENQQVNNEKWAYDDVKTFSVDVADTALHYNLYINVRHSFQFDWRNVWMRIETWLPNGKTFTKRVNLVLSDPAGHWFGHCTGDNCYIQVPLQMEAKFPLPGKYTFKITQDMRVNPLEKIKAVGMRVERSAK